MKEIIKNLKEPFKAENPFEEQLFRKNWWKLSRIRIKQNMSWPRFLSGAAFLLLILPVITPVLSEDTFLITFPFTITVYIPNFVTIFIVAITELFWVATYILSGFVTVEDISIIQFFYQKTNTKLAYAYLKHLMDDTSIKSVYRRNSILDTQQFEIYTPDKRLMFRMEDMEGWNDMYSIYLLSDEPETSVDRWVYLREIHRRKTELISSPLRNYSLTALIFAHEFTVQEIRDADERDVPISKLILFKKHGIPVTQWEQYVDYPDEWVESLATT